MDRTTATAHTRTFRLAVRARDNGHSLSPIFLVFPSPTDHFGKEQSGTDFGKRLLPVALRLIGGAGIPLYVPNRETAGELSARSAPLFGRRRGAVSVTEDAGDPPCAILLRPDHHELGDPLAST